MSIKILNYQGKVLWNKEEFLNPKILYSSHLIPYGNDLVIIKREDDSYAVEPFKNHKEIIGVVTQVKSPSELLASE